MITGNSHRFHPDFGDGQLDFDQINSLAQGGQVHQTIGQALGVTVQPFSYWSGATLVNFAGDTGALVASSTNYISLTSGGALQINQSSHAADGLPLARAITNATAIDSWVDDRPQFLLGGAAGGSTPSLSSFTPTTTWTGNVTWSGGYVDDGTLQTIYIQGTLTGSPTGTSRLEITLPNSKRANITDFPFDTEAFPVGTAGCLDSGTFRPIGYAYIVSGSPEIVFLRLHTNNGTNTIEGSDVNFTTPITWAINDKIQITIPFLPIEDIP